MIHKTNDNLNVLRTGGHTLYRNTYHIVFSTKNRNPVLTPNLKIKIKNWLKLKEEEFNFKILIANGYRDHMHFLISAPLHLSVSKLVQHTKGYTSRQLDNALFWQRGYYCETIEPHEIKKVYRYIRSQYWHHSQEKGILLNREFNFEKRRPRLLKAS